MVDSKIIGSCIGADGPVDSVCLYSEVPLTDIESILLDRNHEHQFGWQNPCGK